MRGRRYIYSTQAWLIRISSGSARRIVCRRLETQTSYRSGMGPDWASVELDFSRLRQADRRRHVEKLQWTLETGALQCTVAIVFREYQAQN